MDDYIRVCDIEKYYGNGSNVTKAVDRVSFSIGKGEFTGIMGASVAWMFSSYETTVLQGKFPFDIQIYSSDPQADFKEEKKIIEQNTDLQSFYSYHIYTDETDQANRWMLTNNQTAWGGMYVNKDGSPKEKEIREMLEEDGTYNR